MDTPRPYDKPGSCSGTGALSTLLVCHPGTVVTPEYPKKPSIFPLQAVDDALAATDLAATDLGRQHHSLQVTSEALAMAQGGHASPRKATKATLAPRPVHTGTVQKGLPPPIPVIASPKSKPTHRQNSGGPRLNKFVRRLHDMIRAEQDSGVVEWRRGLLVLFSTDIFAKKLLPKYFATKNFKTFRRQLNYYGFVHVRSFNTTGASPTALWVNRSLANEDSDNVSSVLKLKRVEPCETARTAEGRRHRKELAKHTVEQDIGVSPMALQMEQIRCLTKRDNSETSFMEDEHHQLKVNAHNDSPIPREVQFVTDSSEGENESSIRGFSRDELGPCSPVSSSLGDIESEGAANVLLMLSRAN